MKKSSLVRRVPRKIGHDEGDEDENSQGQESSLKKPFNNSRKSSSLRISFGGGAHHEGEEDDNPSSGVVTPKRGGNLSRLAVHRNASKRSSLLASQLTARDPQDDDRPTYSAEYLRQLRDSTPSTPRDLTTSTGDPVTDESRALDLSSKFGSTLAQYDSAKSSSIIPSATEIAEKKARRARLAKEQAAEEYISLDPDDPNLDNSDYEDHGVMRDDSGRLVLKPKVDKWGHEESRLVRDDEDILENFDDFTEDGKIALGRNAEAMARRKRKEDMIRKIQEVEGDDSEGDEEEEETKARNAAFEEAQTSHGLRTVATDTSSQAAKDDRPHTPETISPLPTLDGVVERLRRQMNDMYTMQAQKLREMEALQREKIRLGEEEIRIQKALKETAEKFRLLRQENGIPIPDGTSESMGTLAIDGVPDSIHMTGTTPPNDQNRQHVSSDDDGDNDGDYDEEDRPAALGLGHPSSGLGFATI